MLDLRVKSENGISAPGTVREQNVVLGSPLLLSDSIDPVKSCLLTRTALSKQDCDRDYQECLLQDIIDISPHVLPVADFYPSVTGLCSLGTEIPVDMGNTVGFIDNLLLTDDGHLVIVETKLWRSPEALREVVAQILQYGMAISQMSIDELEVRLRKARHTGRELGSEETILQRANNMLARKADDFEDVFDRMRLSSEILLLIVADGIRLSAERLVQWINKEVAAAPFKFGLVELCLYDVPNTGRLVVPKTLLRIREASRHVVSINLQGASKENVTATVSAPNELPKTRKIAPPGIPLTEEALIAQIKTKVSPEIAVLADKLRLQLNLSGLKKRGLPSTIQYGVDVGGDFIPLVSLNPINIWFQIPMRAVRDLGQERFVACKQKINSIAEFYRSEDVSDPAKTNALSPRYALLQDKVEAFVDAVSDIADTVRSAVSEAS